MPARRRVVQRRIALVVLGIDIGFVGQQQFRHVVVAISRRVQRRHAGAVLGIDLGFVGQQQFRHVLVAANRREVQRRLALVVLGIDIGLVGQQQFRHVLVAIKRRKVQRRRAVFVFAENQIRIVFEQRLDLFQVANLGRVMNLAAEGEAAPSQGDQRHPSDGGAAGNWGMAESAQTRVRVHGYIDFLCGLYAISCLVS